MWVDEIRRWHRVVENERHSSVVGDGGHPFDINAIVLWVTNCLAVEKLGVRPNRCSPLVEIVGVLDERDVYAHLWQCVIEQVVRAAVQR